MSRDQQVSGDPELRKIQLQIAATELSRATAKGSGSQTRQLACTGDAQSNDRRSGRAGGGLNWGSPKPMLPIADGLVAPDSYSNKAPILLGD